MKRSLAFLRPKRPATLRLCLLAGLSVALSGCAALGLEKDTPPLAKTETDSPPKIMAALPPADAPSMAALPSLPDAGRLLGLSAFEIQELMGEPTLVRREDRTQIMQYLDEDADCVLDVFLYEPQPGTHFRTQYIEARNRAGETLNPQGCMAQLIPQAQW
ncbi:hypothetical protein GCM10007972_06810 [Iodidimonas muriae]|uniref:Uncharacterized protein n=1 Tax=Iodidimonas muriae TaxID=261467 RepID=A0ABQ2L9N0_9PROT|nr:hypothetical protein [Iodidimonas muriae]GER05920.1 hypothetical protein JCM17843_02300 [Kordiimonadales bacterium JCM 17843]GGO07433.1 hypothetical protein GCM10007972_06810 [Iodidimonas muriae]